MPLCCHNVWIWLHVESWVTYLFLPNLYRLHQCVLALNIGELNSEASLIFSIWRDLSSLLSCVECSVFPKSNPFPQDVVSYCCSLFVHGIWWAYLMGSVMVTFMCQLVWTEDAQIAGKQYLCVCLWGCFWQRLACESVDWEKRVPSPNANGVSQSVKGLSRTKTWKKGKCAVFAWTGTSIFACPWASMTLVLGPSDWDIYHQTSDFQAFRLRLN